MTKTAIVSGATGLVGSQLLHQLISNDSYSRVISITRKPIAFTHPKLEQIVLDFETMLSEAPQIRGDEGYCCLGTTLKAAGSKERQYRIDHDYVVDFATLCHRFEVTRFAVVSSIGANAHSGNFYLRTKGEMEEDLKKIPFKALFILQPSLLIGNRTEYRGGEKAAIALMKVFGPLLGGSLRKYKGVDASDVARCMILNAGSEVEGIHIIHSDQIADQAGSEQHDMNH